MNDQEHNREYKEQMNPSGRHMKCQPTHQPNREQNKKEKQKYEVCEYSHKQDLRGLVHGSGHHSYLHEHMV